MFDKETTVRFHVRSLEGYAVVEADHERGNGKVVVVGSISLKISDVKEDFQVTGIRREGHGRVCFSTNTKEGYMSSRV